LRLDGLLLLALRRVLGRQTDLLMDLLFRLFSPLLVLWRLLDELPCARIARLQFGLDCFVLSELHGVSLISCVLVCGLCLLSNVALRDVLVAHGWSCRDLIATLDERPEGSSPRACCFR
jgi:hypothetical protein